MPPILDDVDSRLLNAIQTQVPLVERPYGVIGEGVGVSEGEVMARLGALKERRIIRQISAIFDSKSLGYQTTLVAAMVEEGKLEAAAGVINGHPGVSHNYKRNHAFNLWYTLAVPPDSRLGLEGTVERLHALSGAVSTRMMPTLKLFKIGVRFDVAGEGELTGRSEAGGGYTEAHRAAAEGMTLTGADKAMIRVLQQDLPLVERPFAAWAESAGVGVGELLGAAERYLERKVMRRFSAVLRHREVGFSANGMGVWAVPGEQVDAFGRTAASFSAVSHCYLRRTYPDWPYNVFTMIHAPSEGQVGEVMKAISEATGVGEYSALFSTKEYKKVRVKYFLGDIERWEEGQG